MIELELVLHIALFLSSYFIVFQLGEWFVNKDLYV